MHIAVRVIWYRVLECTISPHSFQLFNFFSLIHIPRDSIISLTASGQLIHETLIVFSHSTLEITDAGRFKSQSRFSMLTSPNSRTEINAQRTNFELIYIALYMLMFTS